MTGRRQQRGYTLTEMVITVAILGILASVALPVVKFTEKRTKEMELRSVLRQMRSSIDDYKRYSDSGYIPVDLGTDGYPKDHETLVEGVVVVGQVDLKIRFLRRIPSDPITGTNEWGLRSYQDDPDTDSWGSENVYDVYSLSAGVGLNGVPYAQW